jgi:thioredoxin reductase (NADPH)
MEANLCREQEIAVIGGGNSAGQAAVFLSGIARHVHLIIRGDSLSSTMSQYLISRIETSPHITLHTHTQIDSLDGDHVLRCATWLNRQTGERHTCNLGSIFVMIGAEPNTGWLYGTVKLDKKGFIVTGGETAFENSRYATNVPGIYAVGDVRSDSVKRVASAVGEGSVVVSDIHRYLAAHPALTPEAHSTLAALQAVGAGAAHIS